MLGHSTKALMACHPQLLPFRFAIYIPILRLSTKMTTVALTALLKRLRWDGLPILWPMSRGRTYAYSLFGMCRRLSNKQWHNCFCGFESVDSHICLMQSGAARALENYLDVLKAQCFVIISHDHADHVADLGTIQHLLMLPSRAKHAPVPIYLHDQSAFPPFGVRPANWWLMGRIVCGPFRVSFCQTVNHSLLRCVWRTSLADTGWIVQINWIQPKVSMRWLLIRLTQRTGVKREIHMTASEVAQLANQAHVRTLRSLVIWHLLMRINAHPPTNSDGFEPGY